MKRPSLIFLRAGILLAGCLSALLAEGLVVMHFRADGVRSREKMEAATRELRRLHSLQPQPSSAVLERSEAARLAAMKSLEETRSAVLGRAAQLHLGATSAGTSERAEAYFDLARFADGLTELCLAEDIEIPAGMRFGFASYASVAPAADLIPHLVLQSTAIEDLVAALVAAGPKRIESVRRERPASAAGRTGRAAPVTTGQEVGGDAADYLTPDAGTGVARKLGLERLAFRVGFIGSTASLRRFLNHLAECDAPWCVSTVEAHSLEVAGKDADARVRPTGRVGSVGELRGLVPADARFVVTAEWIHGDAANASQIQGEVSG